MIKARGTDDQGNALIILGLSRANTERLHAGMPIRISMVELGFAGGWIYITAGETEEAIAEDLKPLMGLDTVVTDRKKGHRPA